MGTNHGVPSGLDRRFAEFLRRRRGAMTFASFAAQTGLSPSTLFRFENGEQSITLQSLDAVLKRLRCDLFQVFGRDLAAPRSDNQLPNRRGPSGLPSTRVGES